MNKSEILNYLKTLNLNKEQIIIISGASLVVQNIIEQTPDIDIATTTKYYNQLNWPEKIGALGKPIKYYGNVEISNNLYNPKSQVVVIALLSMLSLFF